MNRRYFFKGLASGLVAAVAPALFLPKLVKPKWQLEPKYRQCDFSSYYLERSIILSATLDGFREVVEPMPMFKHIFTPRKIQSEWITLPCAEEENELLVVSNFVIK